MAGVDKDIHGEARPLSGIKIGYLEQEPKLDESKDVRGNVEKGVAEATMALNRLNELYEEYAQPEADFDALAKEQADLEDIIQALDAHNLEHRLEVAADALRLPPWDSEVNSLSGGERRRVALCQLLLSSPDMLLLDEPTNHLDAESISWLERFLDEFPGTVVAITHDRYFLDNAANWILELDRGKGIPYEGNYSDWLSAKELRLQQEKTREASHQKTIKAELEWVRSNPKGRQAKSKARLQRFEELQSQDFQSRNETNEIYIPPGERLGDKVIEVVDLKKSFGERLLFENITFTIPKGSIVGLIGGNGMGKSTLFKILVGSEKADSGKIDIGETVQLGYVDQSRDGLTAQNTVWQEVSDELDIISIGNYEINSRSYLSRFNFKGSDQQKFVKDLSGGSEIDYTLQNYLNEVQTYCCLMSPQMI